MGHDSQGNVEGVRGVRPPMLRAPARAGGFWLAVVLAAGGLALLTWLIPAAPLTGDGPSYVAYAQSQLQHGAASSYHARRVLATHVVGWLPVDPLLGFHMLTLASLWLAGLLMWASARQWGHRA